MQTARRWRWIKWSPFLTHAKSRYRLPNNEEWGAAMEDLDVALIPVDTKINSRYKILCFWDFVSAPITKAKIDCARDYHKVTAKQSTLALWSGGPRLPKIERVRLGWTAPTWMRFPMGLLILSVNFLQSPQCDPVLAAKVLKIVKSSIYFWTNLFASFP